MNGYPSFYHRIALVAPSPGDIELRFEADDDSKIFVVTLLIHYPVIVIQT